jgi:predicted permease
MVTYAFWRRTLGGDPAAVGRVMRLDGVPRTVVGVLPAALDAVLGARAYWIPLALDVSQRENFTPYLELVGRVRPGVSADAAARELAAITSTLGPRAAVDGLAPGVRVVRLDRHWSGDFRQPLLLLLAAAGAVLAIACANAATLVLVRSVGRERELAVRASLGAGRGRLVRQLAVEHLTLGALAAAVAVPAAWAGSRALAITAPAEVPRLAGGGLDARALAVAILLGVGAALLCGIAPALHRRRLDVGRTLRGGGRSVTDARGERWRRTLVGVEVALAVVLLTGAGLFVRSSAALGRVRPGFDPAGVLTARLALPERDYPALPAALRGYDAILDAARRQPGVAAAALVSRVPLGGSVAGIDVAPEGVPLARGTMTSAALRAASPGYFGVMGIPLLAGRDLATSDGARAAPVAVVNATLARRLGGGASPAAVVGRRFRSDNGAFADSAGRPREIEIVGVVGDVLDGGARGAAAPEFYAPLAQTPEEPFNYWIGRELVLVARGPRGTPPAALAPLLRRAATSVDARVPLYDVRTARERLGGAVAVERFSTQLLLVLGAVGLLLAALGVHGVAAYAAGRRERELGLRLALGATPAHAVRLVVEQGMRPVVIGLVAGLVLAVVAWRAAAGLLFGVSPLDPASLLGAATVLAAAGALACYVPARRTARVDPAVALRAE